MHRWVPSPSKVSLDLWPHVKGEDVEIQKENP